MDVLLTQPTQFSELFENVTYEALEYEKIRRQEQVSTSANQIRLETSLESEDIPQTPTESVSCCLLL